MNKTKSNGVMHHSIDFKKEYWEDPKGLGNVLVFLMNSILNSEDFHSRQEKPKYVFTKFEELEKLNKLKFDFECYDVADEDEEKIFISKLDDERRKIYKRDKSL